jgi:WD40 repeat protein/serine/threonine protein kinase
VPQPPDHEIEVFNAALELPTGERGAYLDQVCSGDAGLRQRVEELLQAEDRAGGFLESAAGAPAALAGGIRPLVTPGSKPGDRIGRYKLLEQIGEGGCGVVFMADQEEPVHRLVALKVIKLGMDTKSVIARFEAERQALALMDHPNIAKVLDAGATETGRPYFVMELVRGVKITDYCDQNNLSTGERLEMFIQVCQAIQHAHQKGIIHRDIKPSNILVTVNDPDKIGMPKVIDFGIAKATQGKLTDQTLFTAFEQFIGTPAYMSPEQAEMSPDPSGDIDTRSDIYSLGVLLYELLTGNTPFDTKELLRSGLNEMRQIIRERQPVRPSTRLSQTRAVQPTTSGDSALRIPHSAINPDLDWMVMKCLEKDRNRRYETANGLAMDVQRYLADEPVVARPPSNWYRFQKFVRRNKLAFGAGAAISIVLALGVVVSTSETLRALRAERRQSVLLADARQARENEAGLRRTAQSEAKRAEAAAMDLRISLSTSHLLEGLRLMREDNWNNALAYLVRCLSSNPTNSAALAALTTWLTYHSWPLPDLMIPDARGAHLAEFSPDGRRIVIAWRDGTVRVWDTQIDKWLTEPMKHTNALLSAQFSRDGKRIVTGSFDYTARVWDAQTGQPITEPMVHGGYVYTAQFDFDGKRIVTASSDGTARVWDAQTGQPLVELMKHSSYVSSAEFSPDGERVLTASADKTARVWRAETGQLMQTLTHDGPVHYAGFSPDGKRIVTASADRTARVWDTQTGHPVTNPMVHGGAVLSARFSPDGLRIVTASGGPFAEDASEDHAARVWDAQTGQPLTEPMRHRRTVDFAQFSPDGRRILTGSRDGTARIWNAQNGEPLTESLTQVGSPRFSPDGKRVLTTSAAGAPCLWNVESGRAFGRLLKHSGNIKSAQFSPDGNRVLTASLDKTARVWDAQSGRAVGEPMRHGGYVWSAEFSRDAARVVTASADKTARVWDAETGRPLTEPLQHPSEVISAQFSPDGLRIVTVSADSAAWSKAAVSNASGGLESVTVSAGNAARVWDVRGGQALTGPMAHSSMIVSAQFSPDGNQILTASWDNSARLWDARTGGRLLKLVHGDEIFFAKFNADGSQILTSCRDGSARLWDARTGRLLAARFGHGIFFPRSAQWSRDGTRLLTASDDGTARVWDVRTGERLGEVIHEYPMVSAQFSLDEERILTSSMDRTARLWDARTGQPLAEPWKLGQHGDYHAQFGPGDRRILTSGEDEAWVWDMAPARGPCPDWLLPLSEAISGMVLSPQGLLENTSLERAATLKEIRRRLDKEKDDSDWVIWGRWLLADRATRTISPFSKITVPEYAERQNKEKIPQSSAGQNGRGP